MMNEGPFFHPINRRKGVTFPPDIETRFEEWRNPGWNVGWRGVGFVKSVNRERRNVEELFGQTQTTGRAEFFFRREATAAAATAFDPAKTGRPRPPNFWPNLRSHTRPKQSRISLSLSLFSSFYRVSRWRCFQFIRNRETSGRWSFVKLISKEFSSYFDSLENYLCESIHFWKISPFNCTPGMLSWGELGD